MRPYSEKCSPQRRKRLSPLDQDALVRVIFRPQTAHTRSTSCSQVHELLATARREVAEPSLYVLLLACLRIGSHLHDHGGDEERLLLRLDRRLLRDAGTELFDEVARRLHAAKILCPYLS
jgi:hypothetical protein